MASSQELMQRRVRNALALSLIMAQFTEFVLIPLSLIAMKIKHKSLKFMSQVSVASVIDMRMI